MHLYEVEQDKLYMTLRSMLAFISVTDVKTFFCEYGQHYTQFCACTCRFLKI